MSRLYQITCGTCGAVVGYTRNPNQFSAWCSAECADTPVSLNPERDELICELFLDGRRSVSYLADRYQTSYQNIHQILTKRGIRLNDVPRDMGTTQDHTAFDGKKKGASIS